jgi:protein SCO1/2
MHAMDTLASSRYPALARWLAALVCAAFLLPIGASADDSGRLRLDQLPQRWLDDRGQALSLAALAGRRVILSMSYTQCHHTCPTTLARLQGMQSALDQRKESASFVIVGYDPDQDKPASWRQYRANRRLERPNWYFLSGSRQNVRQLAQQLGFEFWIYDTHVLHDPRVVVFDGEGLLSATLTDASNDWLAAH